MARKKKYLKDKEREELEKSLYDRVQKTAGCWYWMGNKQFNIRINYKQYKAKTLIWELHHNEEVPSKQLRLKSCDKSKICVNPEHIDLMRITFGAKQ
jgi:hypothetical protein